MKAQIRIYFIINYNRDGDQGRNHKYSFTKRNNLFLEMKINTCNYHHANESYVIIHPQRMLGNIYIFHMLYRAWLTIVNCLFIIPGRLMPTL